MQIQIFTIPVMDNEERLAELNSFLANHRIAEIQTRFGSNNGEVYWCFCIKWIQSASTREGTGKKRSRRVDYRKVLGEKEFNTFTILRECRRQISREEGIPAYAVFTDEELAKLARLPVLSKEEMQSIRGIGEKRAERYGERFLEFLETEGLRHRKTEEQP